MSAVWFPAEPSSHIMLNLLTSNIRSLQSSVNFIRFSDHCQETLTVVLLSLIHILRCQTVKDNTARTTANNHRLTSSATGCMFPSTKAEFPAVYLHTLGSREVSSEDRLLMKLSVSSLEEELLHLNNPLKVTGV